MQFISKCLLTMIIVKTVSANKSKSIFEEIGFNAYFDIVQCSLLLILTVFILILTVVHFHQTKPCKLTLSRPSSFEYYILVGEKSGLNKNSTSCSTIGTRETGASMSGTATTGTTTGTTGTTTGRTRTETSRTISYFAM